MFEKFTPEAIKVIMLAQEETRRLGHNFVGPEQLLLGLLGENKGFAGKALRQAGLNLRETRGAVEHFIGRGSGIVEVEIPFTAPAKRSLEASWDYARSQHVNYIGTEHLLVGVLSQDEEEVAHRALSRLGISPQRVREELEKVMKLPSGTADFKGVAGGAEPRSYPHCQWCNEEISVNAKICHYCDRPQGENAKRCPSCAEIIWSEATICRFCNSGVSQQRWS